MILSPCNDNENVPSLCIINLYIRRKKMRKVILRMNEQFKYETIKKLVETNGNKKRAAIKLQCTTRTINRLIKLYQANGKEGFVHKNRNRIPLTAFDQETKEKVIKLYSEKFGNANIKHYSEILEEDYQIKISDTTIMKWLKDEYILSPMARKNTKRLMKKTLKNLLNETKSKKAQNQIKESI